MKLPSIIDCNLILLIPQRYKDFRAPVGVKNIGSPHLGLKTLLLYFTLVKSRLCLYASAIKIIALTWYALASQEDDDAADVVTRTTLQGLFQQHACQDFCLGSTFCFELPLVWHQLSN